MEFFTNLKYQSVGVLIVLTSLGGLAVIVSLVAAALAPGHAARSKASATQAAKAPVVSASSETVPPEIFAVIAAAVAVSVKIPHEILEIHPVQNPMLSAWSVEGRRQIFQSHSVR